MKKNTPPINPYVKIALMLIMGVFMSLSIGCASLEVGGGSGKSYPDLEKMVKDKVEPKWDKTGDAELDDAGSTVVVGWAKDVYAKMQDIDKITKGSADYSQLLALAYKDLPGDATAEDRSKAVDAELAKIKDKNTRKKILETSKSVDARQDELQKEIAKYIKQFPEIQEKLKAVMDSAKEKHSGFSPAALKALKPYKDGVGSVKSNFSYIQDCQQVNIWNR